MLIAVENDTAPVDKSISAKQITVRQTGGTGEVLAVIEEDENGGVFVLVPPEVKVYIDGELVPQPAKWIESTR